MANRRFGVSMGSLDKGLAARSPINRAAMFALVIGSLVGSKAVALDPTKVLSEFHHTQWTVRDGAPTANRVIAQTSDGFLWVGSETGLFQFDGVRFVLFSLPDGSHPITSDVSALYSSADGELWIGMRFGGAYLWNHGQLTRFGSPEGLPAHAVLAFARRDDHSLWAQTVTGLYRLDGKDWRSIGKEWNYPLTDGFALFIDRDGTLWSRGLSGTYFLRRNSHSFDKSSIPGGPGRILNGPDGAAWVYDAAHLGFFALSGNSRTVSASEVGGLSFGGVPLLDSDKGLWLFPDIQGGSLLVRVPDASLLLTGHKLSEQAVQRLKPSQTLTGGEYDSLEDREGNIWFVGDGGIDRFRENKLHSALESMSHSGNMSMIVDRGTILMCNNSFIVAFPRGSVAPETVTPEDVSSQACSSIWV
jgi:streptogramin lyase